ncbi:MAG: hypothetical protein KDH88_05345 [Chromatiales bacterium]|nr:hypothetical protein [Chromatiales bacterium]
MITKTAHVVVAISLVFSANAYADTAKGRIHFLSNKAKTIQIVQDGNAVLVSFDDNTEFVNADGAKELGHDDLIVIEYQAGKPATKITKQVFGIAKELEVDVDQLEAIRHGSTPYVLVDARPPKRFGAGHIPGAISIAGDKIAENADKLPADKNHLIIFYCGGPTCPFTAKAIAGAQALGYTNVKGFQAGLPGWKKAGKPVSASPAWVAENLNENHVVLDTRAQPGNEHLPTAATMPATYFTGWTSYFVNNGVKARLPGASDKAAPIILYGATDQDPDLLVAFGELKKWGYKNPSIMEGGISDWKSAGRKLESGAPADQIRYVRKLRKGAIEPARFKTLATDPAAAAIIDVRAKNETGGGAVKGALLIPLDELESRASDLPTDKPIITYCSNGIRAEMAYELLKNKGFEQVNFLNETIHPAADGSFRIE